jgi:hypothetical protein
MNFEGGNVGRRGANVPCVVGVGPAIGCTYAIGFAFLLVVSTHQFAVGCDSVFWLVRMGDESPGIGAFDEARHSLGTSADFLTRCTLPVVGLIATDQGPVGGSDGRQGLVVELELIVGCFDSCFRWDRTMGLWIETYEFSSKGRATGSKSSCRRYWLDVARWGHCSLIG